MANVPDLSRPRATDTSNIGYVANVGYAATDPLPKFGDPRCGVIVPAYMYPNNPYSDAQFTRMLDLVRKHRNVPTMVIINCGGSLSGRPGGAGLVWDGNFAAAIRLLKAAGAVVVGYVSTNYAVLSYAQVKADIDQWTTLYSATLPHGIFLDEFPYAYGTNNANVTLYQSYYNYIRDTKRYSLVVGNPGANEQQGWYSTRTADVIVTWESATPPTEAELRGAFVGEHWDYDYNYHAFMLHTQTTLDAFYVRRMRRYAKWMYITDDVMPNPYDVFPTYLEELYALLGSDDAPSHGLTVLTDAATVAWDASETVNAQVTIGANRTMGAPTNLVRGIEYTLVIKRTGTWTMAFNAVYKLPTGTTLPLSGGVANVHTLKFLYDGTNMLCTSLIAI